MSRYPEPPPGFVCRYRYECPHLDGLSAQWALSCYHDHEDAQGKYWTIYDEYRNERDRLEKKVRKLEEMNAQLCAKLKALHQRQFKKTKIKPPETKPGETDNPSPPKKRGVPRGHPGWSRPKPSRIDKRVRVPAPKVCPHCAGDNLVPSRKTWVHVQEDIVLEPRTQTTQYVHDQVYCRNCRLIVYQTNPDELPNCPIGPTAKAVSIFLRHGVGLTYRKVRDVMKVFFGMEFVPASAMGFDRQATRKGEPLYEDLREKVRALAVAHADETHWRENGCSAFVWYAGNRDVGVYHIDRSRSSEIAVLLLGEQFEGVLTADGYAAYNATNSKARQACLAHLIRTAKEIHQEILLAGKKFQDNGALRFCERIIKFLQRACVIAHECSPRERTRYETRRLRRNLYEELNRLCKRKLAHERAETFRQRLRDPQREYHRLFTFLDYPGVEPTNNHAEQSLRWLVIFRKLCFGTRSGEGSHSLSVLASLVVTARRQGVHPLQFLRALLTSEPAAAQNMLYNNSS